MNEREKGTSYYVMPCRHRRLAKDWRRHNIKFFRPARLMLSKTVKLCLIFVECQSWSWIENVNFCKNCVRATILHVKLAFMAKDCCQAYVQKVKVC